jgi:hypothetical protein
VSFSFPHNLDHARIHQHQALVRPTRSIYALTRQEITRGIANRFVYSRIYSILYLAMAALSITTVVLSLVDGCPGLPFYILEFIINFSLIIEVGIRFVAFGGVSHVYSETCVLI